MVVVVLAATRNRNRGTAEDEFNEVQGNETATQVLHVETSKLATSTGHACVWSKQRSLPVFEK